MSSGNQSSEEECIRKGVLPQPLKVYMVVQYPILCFQLQIAPSPPSPLSESCVSYQYQNGTTCTYYTLKGKKKVVVTRVCYFSCMNEQLKCMQIFPRALYAGTMQYLGSYPKQHVPNSSLCTTFDRNNILVTKHVYMCIELN